MTRQKIGIIGLGTMGSGFMQRLTAAGYSCIGYDKEQHKVTLADVAQTEIIFLLIPHTALDSTLRQLVPLLTQNVTLVDAGNSNFHDSIRRAQALANEGIQLLDCGTSGGALGAKEGYALTVGGNYQAFVHMQQIFAVLAQRDGLLYTGESGSGHYAKMVHNAIEYGMLQALAEGMELLAHAPTPLDLPAVVECWNHGAIIQSKLLELTPQALSIAAQSKGVLARGGMTDWAVQQAQETDVAVPCITSALEVRKQSEEDIVSFGTRYIAALRHIFGNHHL